MSTDDEHLRHVVRQHLTGITYVDCRLCETGSRLDLKHWDRGLVMVLPQPGSAQVSPCSENPELNISQGEDGNGLRDTFLQLVLNSRGPKELDTESPDRCYYKNAVDR